MKKAILSINFYSASDDFINTENYDSYYIPNVGDSINNVQSLTTTFYVTKKEYYYSDNGERCHVVIMAKANF